MRNCRTRSGFALLLTLFLIVMVGIALTGLARRSMFGALEAQDATEELQRRWALTSLRAATLSRVPILLAIAEKSRSTRQRVVSLPKLPLTCRLSGIDYDLVLTDEQAKLNVDRFLRQTNSTDTQNAIKRLMPRSTESSASVHVHLRPSARQGDGQSLPALGSFGQLFDQASPQDLLGTNQQPGLSSRITCWGNGRINIHRASPEVLQLVCDQILTRDQITKLLRRRDDDPSRKFSDVLDGLSSLDDKTKSQLSTLFTDETRCFGLWIVARGTQRSWFTFVAAEGTKKTIREINARPSILDFQLTQERDFTW
jgi:type II secretory pathway component PulK